MQFPRDKMTETVTVIAQHNLVLKERQQKKGVGIGIQCRRFPQEKNDRDRYFSTKLVLNNDNRRKVSE